MCAVPHCLFYLSPCFYSPSQSPSFFVRGDSVKKFLFQNVNLIEIDNDQDTNEIQLADELKEKADNSKEALEGDAFEGAFEKAQESEATLANQISDVDAQTQAFIIDETAVAGGIGSSIDKVSDDVALDDYSFEQKVTADLQNEAQIIAAKKELLNDAPQDYIEIEPFVDDDDNRELDVASQISDDHDESTIINNDNYDVNNDSAYETNEIYSHNGSNSRLQSADTNDGDVDNETGENFLLKAQKRAEIENAKALQEEALQMEMENLEFERIENELQNPPTPSDVVMSRAVNPIKSGDSTNLIDELTGNRVANQEVHDLYQNFSI